MNYTLHERYVRRRDLTIAWIANRLPKRLVYYCAIRVVVHGTTGTYSNQEVPALYATDALKRFHDDLIAVPRFPRVLP